MFFYDGMKKFTKKIILHSLARFWQASRSSFSRLGHWDIVDVRTDRLSFREARGQHVLEMSSGSASG